MGSQSSCDALVQQLEDHRSSTACVFPTLSTWHNKERDQVVTSLTSSNERTHEAAAHGIRIVKTLQHPNVLHYVADTPWNGKQISMQGRPAVSPLLQHRTTKEEQQQGKKFKLNKAMKASPSLQPGATQAEEPPLVLSEILSGLSGVLSAVVMCDESAVEEGKRRVVFKGIGLGSLCIVPTAGDSVHGGRWVIADCSRTQIVEASDGEQDVLAPKYEGFSSRAVGLLLLETLQYLLADSHLQRQLLTAICDEIVQTTADEKYSVDDLQNRRREVLSALDTYLQTVLTTEWATLQDLIAAQHLRASHQPKIAIAASHVDSPPAAVAPSTAEESPKQVEPEVKSDPALVDEAFRQRIIRFFTAYNPEKLDGVDRILDRYAARQDVLIGALEAKYGPEPNEDGTIPELGDGEEEEQEEAEEETMRESSPHVEERAASNSPLPGMAVAVEDHKKPSEAEDAVLNPVSTPPPESGDGGEVVDNSEDSQAADEEEQESNTAEAPVVSEIDETATGTQVEGSQPVDPPATDERQENVPGMTEVETAVAEGTQSAEEQVESRAVPTGADDGSSSDLGGANIKFETPSFSSTEAEVLRRIEAVRTRGNAGQCWALDVLRWIVRAMYKPNAIRQPNISTTETTGDSSSGVMIPPPRPAVSHLMRILQKRTNDPLCHHLKRSDSVAPVY